MVRLDKKDRLFEDWIEMNPSTNLLFSVAIADKYKYSALAQEALLQRELSEKELVEFIKFLTPTSSTSGFLRGLVQNLLYIDPSDEALAELAHRTGNLVVGKLIAKRILQRGSHLPSLASAGTVKGVWPSAHRWMKYLGAGEEHWLFVIENLSWRGKSPKWSAAEQILRLERPTQKALVIIMAHALTYVGPNHALAEKAWSKLKDLGPSPESLLEVLRMGRSADQYKREALNLLPEQYQVAIRILDGKTPRQLPREELYW